VQRRQTRPPLERCVAPIKKKTMILQKTQQNGNFRCWQTLQVPPKKFRRLPHFHMPLSALQTTIFFKKSFYLAKC